MTFKQVIGIVLGSCLLVSLGWKLMDGLSGTKNADVILFMVFLIFLAILMGIRMVLRE